MNGLFWILIALGANMLSGMCIRKGHDKIIDMGHNVLPLFPGCTNDVLALITLVLAFVYRDRLTPKYIKVLSIMFLFRAITICLTILPIPPGRSKCKEGLIQHCNDFIFSGHTTFNVVTSYFIGKPVWPLWPILTSLGTVGSRNHYTIDVALVWFIFFSLYIKI